MIQIDKPLPENCNNCILSYVKGDDVVCAAADQFIWDNDITKQRAEFCPLLLPSRPIQRYLNDFRCRICNREVRKSFDVFCSRCGVKLDWSK